MTFLCEHHRKKIEGNPVQAQLSWQKVLHIARARVEEMRWNQAVIFYGNALEISEILLNHDAISGREVYLRTAVELMHALRNSEHWYDPDAMCQMVIDRLEQNGASVASGKILKPLQDVAFLPLDEVNQWMVQWHAMQQRMTATLH